MSSTHKHFEITNLASRCSGSGTRIQQWEILEYIRTSSAQQTLWGSDADANVSYILKKIHLYHIILYQMINNKLNYGTCSQAVQ